MIYPPSVQQYIIRRDFIAALQLADSAPRIDPEGLSLLRVLATLQFEGGAPFERAIALFDSPEAPFWLLASRAALDDTYALGAPAERAALFAKVVGLLYDVDQPFARRPAVTEQ